MYKGLIEKLSHKTDSKILLAVVDGLGDIPVTELGGRTPLEAAVTPELDRLAVEGALGLHIPVARGVTPGSGPAHLSLFGYDPVEYEVGRGVLAALGVEFDLRNGDLAARINFCTVDQAGTILDRRAGRISTERCRELVLLLSGIEIPGVEIFVIPVKEHRACVVFRGDGLSDDIPDTDPGLAGRKPIPVTGSGRSALVVREFQKQAGGILEHEKPANSILLRGFAIHREFPSMKTRFRLNAAAAALYPMYRGVAKLVGMDILMCDPQDLHGQAAAAREALSAGHDFVFLHHKPADSSGEDGDVPAKIGAIEAFDRALPDILEVGFDLVCVTGDHSTPCSMKLHSWHPVPVLLHGGFLRTGYSSAFSEREAASGSLGTMMAMELISLLLAVSGKLDKFGA